MLLLDSSQNLLFSSSSIYAYLIHTYRHSIHYKRMAKYLLETAQRNTRVTTTSANFWDQVAEKYSQQPIADLETYERKLKITQAHMENSMQVLEFGCGTGSTALKHAPYASRIVATDLSNGMLEVGRNRALEAGINNVIFEQSGIEDFTAPDESFDMVLALNLLHLVPDRKHALAKINKLLKPGGIFVSSTVCLADRMWFVRPVIPVMQWLGKAPYVSFIKATQMQSEISEAGFKAEEHWTHGLANSLFMVASKTED